MTNDEQRDRAAQSQMLGIAIEEARQGLIEGGRQRIVLREPHRLFVLAEETRDGGPPVKP